MRLFLAPNGFTGRQVEQAMQCFHLLSESGHTCAVSAGDSLRLFGGESGAAFAPGECDLIVSLGGDGSVLRAAQLALAWNKPLLGINSGRLGWLCAMDFDEIRQFDTTLAHCELSQGKLLAFTYGGEVFRAVNDVVIGKRNFGGTVDLDVAVDEGGPARLRGDGLIIATPTGSTAYNLSAGGPLLDTGLGAVLLTPICPHGSFSRCVAVRDDRTIQVTVRNDHAGLYADGRYVGDLDGTLSVHLAQKPLLIYTRKERKADASLWGMTEMEHGR